jgi:predicted nicotinamide N-methyase
MTSIEAFARKGEKNMLKNMFKEDGASSDDSMSETESDKDERLCTKMNKGSVSAVLNGISVSDGSGIFSAKETDDDINTPDICALSIAETNDSETTTDFYHSISKLFTISLHQQRKKGIAHQLWPAATHLSQYIESNVHKLYPNCRPENTGILELGAGIGLCGLVCSALKFKKVIVTDLPVAQDILNSNIALNTPKNNALQNNDPRSSTVDLEFIAESDLNIDANIEAESSSHYCTNPSAGTGSGTLPGTAPVSVCVSDACLDESVSAQVLSWGNHEELVAVMKQFDSNSPVLVIAADCVYWEILFKPLCDTLKDIVTEYNAEIIMSHVRRWKKDEKFFKMCRKIMTVELLEEIRELVPAEHTGIPTREIKRIYRIKAKLPI